MGESEGGRETEREKEGGRETEREGERLREKEGRRETGRGREGGRETEGELVGLLLPGFKPIELVGGRGSSQTPNEVHMYTF